jgi:hypothetical protein
MMYLAALIGLLLTMTVYIKLDDSGFQWLKKLLDNTMAADPNSHIKLTYYPQLESCYNAFSEAYTLEQLGKLEEVQGLFAAKKVAAAKATTRPTKVRKKRIKKADKDPYQCPAHPNYQAARVPRTDCAKCWDLYRQFHPMDYQAKRRAFERKHS